jgi:hypothetical protein
VDSPADYSAGVRLFINSTTPPLIPARPASNMMGATCAAVTAENKLAILLQVLAHCAVRTGADLGSRNYHAWSDFYQKSTLVAVGPKSNISVLLRCIYGNGSGEEQIAPAVHIRYGSWN